MGGVDSGRFLPDPRRTRAGWCDGWMYFVAYVFAFAAGLAFAGAFFAAAFFFGAAFFLTLPLGGIAARASINCAASSNVSSFGEMDLGKVAFVVPSVT